MAGHLRATAAVSASIALALASQVAIGFITTVALGRLGDTQLAAGTLGTTIFTTGLLVMQGGLSGVGVLAAGHVGAGRMNQIAPLYWSSLALAGLLSLPVFALLGQSAPLLRAAGQPAALAAEVGRYMAVLRWAVPAGAVGMGVIRQLLPALGLQRVLLHVMPGTVVLHLALNVLLIHGAPGLRPLGMIGAALATVISYAVAAVAMAVLLHRGCMRGMLAPTRPDRERLLRLVALGLPGGGIIAAESGLFLATGILAGTLGPTVLAAHMIALNVSSLFFLVPLSLSQAANVRVAQAQGAGCPADARRAGLAPMLLAAGFMGCSALLLFTMPGRVAWLYLGSAAARDPAGVSLVRRLLRIAGLFQIVDGLQVTAAGALRGLQDMRVPMLLAMFGYWAVGFTAGWILAFRAGLGAPGLWWGLFAGLATVALSLCVRFARLTRPRTPLVTARLVR